MPTPKKLDPTRKKTGGRKAGVPNKVNGQIKDMICEALNNVGGVAYLERQAEENPKAFLTLVAKVMPTQITGDGGGPLVMQMVGTDAAL